MIPTLHLASSSPRRQEILRSLGLEFTVMGVEIDESRQDGESPQQMVRRLAAEKAAAAAAADGQLVIGADTVVVLGDRVLGKPRDVDEAIEMLTSLSGRSHTVLSGIALRTPTGPKTALSVTEVRVRELGRDEALAYWPSGESADKAGAYALQGLGGSVVESRRGMYSGFVGLPVYDTVGLLKNAGIDVVKNKANETA